MKKIAVYIHIPFCSSKCYYCDFVSFPNMDNRIDQYINYLIKEMDMYKDILEEYTIDTIFFGGGTPSYIDEKHIGRIFEYIYSNYNSSEINEITIEANPETVTYKKLKTYKDIGINRISIGLQSTKDTILKEIGRRHTFDDFLKAYETARKAGFENINVDLIFGLPNQTVKDCIHSLDTVVALGVEHISYYSLIIEEGTLMDKWYKEGKLKLPDEDSEREMYHRAIEFLEAKGYKHYEISNFAREGYECRHNLYYWKIKPYIGFGISSHSNIGNKRFWNYKNYNEYTSSLKNGHFPVEGKEYIDENMKMIEYMIMGLRLIDGVDKEEFKDIFKVDLDDRFGMVLEKYKKQGLLTEEDGNIRFSKKGLDLSNIVYVDLLPN